MLPHIALKSLIFDIVFHSEQYFWQKSCFCCTVIHEGDVTRSISVDRYQHFGTTFYPHLE